MSGESRESGFQVRLAATGASDGVLVAADQLLEFSSTVVTDIFVNWHVRWLPQGAFFLILAHWGGRKVKVVIGGLDAL